MQRDQIKIIIIIIKRKTTNKRETYMYNRDSILHFQAGVRKNEV